MSDCVFAYLWVQTRVSGVIVHTVGSPWSTRVPFVGAIQSPMRELLGQVRFIAMAQIQKRVRFIHCGWIFWYDCSAVKVAVWH